MSKKKTVAVAENGRGRPLGRITSKILGLAVGDSFIQRDIVRATLGSYVWHANQRGAGRYVTQKVCKGRYEVKRVA